MKPSLRYLFVSLLFIAAYIIIQAIQHASKIEKEIVYTSPIASEIYIVWGLMKRGLPPEKFWPLNSHKEDKVIYTKMTGTNDKFSAIFTLPAGTEIYYWIVLKKDKAGRPTEIWETGGDSKIYYTLRFAEEGCFQPGIFILLAGLLPLLLHFFQNRKRSADVVHHGVVKQKAYIPQFDTVRGIAVLLVIIHHWLPENKFLNIFPNGRLGVNIFFVLSGFLITGILLKAKRQIDEKKISRKSAFTTFYIRRTLRIFPIYYLVLCCFLIFSISPLKEGMVFYITYTANLLFYKSQYFPERLSHLWSLAVEEQFYLLWPWLIIFVQRKFLPYLIGLFLVIGISSNYIFTSKGWWVEIFTPACFDAFATGALLAYIIAFRQDVINMIQPKYAILLSTASVLVLLDAFGYPLLPARTSHSFFAICIIYYCLFKNNIKVVNYILNNKWLIRIGKVSYGVYLYHLFVPEMWAWVNKKFSSFDIDLFYNNAIPQPYKAGWLFIQQFSFLMLICFISWKFIEKPINNLKKRFEYKNPEKTLPTAAEVKDPKVYTY